MKETHRKIGIMYDKSKAMAVSEKMAFTAIGLARSRRPGMILIRVVNQIARRGVIVHELTCPKYPRSGSPIPIIIINTTCRRYDSASREEKNITYRGHD